MANPPPAVKLALESICLLINVEANDWKQIRQVLNGDNFIPSIVNFDTLSLTYDFYFLNLKKKKTNRFNSKNNNNIKNLLTNVCYNAFFMCE